MMFEEIVIEVGIGRISGKGNLLEYCFFLDTGPENKKILFLGLELGPLLASKKLMKIT